LSPLKDGEALGNTKFYPAHMYLYGLVHAIQKAGKRRSNKYLRKPGQRENGAGNPLPVVLSTTSGAFVACIKEMINVQDVVGAGNPPAIHPIKPAVCLP
jgi:hypothetical protein